MDDDPGPSSSFPLSSPTFWTEAAKVSTPPVKRSHREVESALHDGSPRTRPRLSSPDWDGDSGANTTLSYLPSRKAAFEQDDPHGYLASAEYAPNKFGDIGDYMRKKEIKVQTQNRDIALGNGPPIHPQIFAGLSFHINGNTHPPMEELRKMILQRGGEVRPKLHNKGLVNFIIAPMLTQMKFRQFARYKVVKEGWIVESCKEERLLEWHKWKLQPEGGWEAEGRKGLEGFFGGRPRSGESGHAEEAEEVEQEEEEQVEHPGNKAAAVPIEPISILSASTRSLLRPPTSTAASQAQVPAPAPPSIAANAATAAPAPAPAPAAALAPLQAKEKRTGWWEMDYTKDSNADAARLLQDKEWRVKNTAERGNEGGFIDGYYQNSRLHHLSTWKAELRVLVADAQRQSEEQALCKPSVSTVSNLSLATSNLPRAGQTTIAPGERIIFHVDFDCFFVSCGLATRPHLKGKPVVVCHSQTGKGASSTSEIASASYEARAKGVKNGMSLGRARTLVGEELQTIPYEFETYKKFSLSFYTTLMGFADELQAVSVDEALIDVTSAVAARAAAPDEMGQEGPSDPAVQVAEKIRDEVRALTDGCEVSIGIAHNILLAKLGTRKAKPAGVHHVLPEGVASLLDPLDVNDLPSIGYSIRGKIEDKFGTTICGQLLKEPRGALKALLGPKTGDMLYGYLRGEDERKLEPHKERKSISAEMNYGIRFQNQEQAEIYVVDLAAEVSKRMKQVNARGRQITLKLMARHPEAPIEPPKFLGHGWCETFNKSCPIANKGGGATDDAEILGQEAVKLLRAMRIDPKELRGVGIQMTKLDGDKDRVIEREAGQGTLSFGLKKKKDAVEDSPARAPDSPRASGPDIQITKGKAKLPTAATAPAAPSPPITRRRSAQPGPSKIADLSSDGIDPDFLAALPPDLQQEVKRDHAATKKARKAAIEPPPEAEVVEVVEVVEEIESPSKGRHAAAHITRQLRPKVKTQLKAGAVAELPLYGAWARAGRTEETVDLTGDSSPKAEDKVGNYQVSELKELGIDPEVFGALPEDMQKEIIKEERRKIIQRKILHRPADTSRLSARERERDRGATSLSPGSARASRANSAAPQPKRPLIAVSLAPKPTLLKAIVLPDVLETITRWIDSRKGAAPAEKDAAKVRQYLVRCFDPGMGLQASENALEVLKWMRMEIGLRWGEQDDMADGSAGQAWWGIWTSFRAVVDQLAIEKFGAPFRL